MKQNIYDNPEFFESYMRLRAKESGLNLVLEQPAFDSLLPDLRGLTVLDLGCGIGHFATKALDSGAAHVTGVDISRRMLEVASKRIRSPHVEFIQCAVEDYEIRENRFDLIVSSLCFHYVKNIAPVLREAYRGLKAGGQFVFSVEHPICTALLQGWITNEDGLRMHWPVDRYQEEGTREHRWFVDGVIKYHRTVETYINTLLDTGFAITRLLEPGPVERYIADRPDLVDDTRRPPFLLIACRKEK